MLIEVHSKDALISAARTARKPIAVLVGSPLSTDSGGGVPRITPMLDVIREEIAAHANSELPRFEHDIRGKSGGDAYQAAMRWLQGNLTQDAVNRVVRAAVLRARKAGTPAAFDCDGKACDWHLPAGTQELAALVCLHRDRFPGPILTTNFDPLLSLAIESCGGRPHLRVIQSDGSLAQDVKRVGDIDVVHLHGFWRDSDTLHTPAQLTAPRPRLKDSLKETLRQRTLIVVAYGGWDDVFATALAEVTVDETAQLTVLWCFRDTDAGTIERDYRQLLERVQQAITRGRLVAYGGIDCHSIFGEIATALPAAVAVPVGGVGAGLPPIAGWQLITPPFLGALTPLNVTEVVRYFDGAVPTWRHAVSDAIPRREAVAKLGTRFAKAERAKAACTLQLIRAAGGEGKSTLVLQAAVEAARGGWMVLWRTSPEEGLPHEHVALLDPSRQWLVVADDADNLVRDLADSARRLNNDGRTHIHFLLAARDADWRNAKGDKQPWEEWLTRQPDVTLRGISHEDAGAVVHAWAKCGEDGLRKLGTHGDTASQVAALEDAIRDAADEQLRQSKHRKPTDGSFFGGLLAVRFGQDALQAHVRAFLDRLRHVPIEGGDAKMFDALLYVAACHGAGIPGIDERVLADLVGVPRTWVQSRVVRPLGEEATAVHSAGHVHTRHSKVAAAILVEAERTFDVDLGEVWTRVVSQTVGTGRDIRMDSHWYSLVVHIGPRLQGRLPIQLPEDHRKAIAIAAAKASTVALPNRLDCVVDVGKAYRVAGKNDQGHRIFRENLASVSTKVDYLDVIRGYWYEWSVCEGERGTNREHAVANAWLGGLSLSDHLNPAQITDEQSKLSCAGLGVAFGKLVRPDLNCAYAKARRAVAYLGRLTNPDPKTARYYDKYDAEADKLKTPHAKDVTEAIDWLEAGVRQAGRELQDQFLATLASPLKVSFGQLRSVLGPRRAS